MKKFMVALIASAVMCAGAFAGGKYHGDIQLHAGGSLGSINYRIDVGSSNKQSIEMRTELINFDVATWHMWDINDFFSFGGMCNIYGGFGKFGDIYLNDVKQTISNNTSYEGPFYLGMLIGPAVGLKFGEVVKLNIALGLGTDYLNMMHSTVTYSNANKNRETYLYYSGVGFGTEIQAKFLPGKKVSPVVGYRFVFLAGDEAKGRVKIGTSGWKSESQKLDTSLTFYNTFYLGVSFNW